MFTQLKKLFLPKITDKQVEKINAESKSMLEETSKTAQRHRELLDNNGFTLRIYIATGGDHRNVR